jgi:leader peptidase (prepilin peptidase)/N-methyltransferase
MELSLTLLQMPAVFLGAVFGSFLGTTAMRSAQGRAWTHGASACDHCQTPLPLWRSVPLISFALLRGRCASCRAPISWLHPAAEAAGALIVLTAFRYGLGWDEGLWAALGFLLLFAAIYDVRTRRIPDALSLAVFGLGAVAAWRSDDPLGAAAACAAVLAALSAARWAFARVKGTDGIGGGDIKLVSAAALWLGPERLPLGVALSAALALGWLAVDGRLASRSQEPLPFAPFIGLGCWAVLMGAHL